VRKSELLAALKQEIQRHDFSTFITEGRSVAQGGNGVCVPGCPRCKKQLNTIPRFINHLTDDVLPKFLDKLSSEAKATAVYQSQERF
jgi:hypothetical protein